MNSSENFKFHDPDCPTGVGPLGAAVVTVSGGSEVGGLDVVGGFVIGGLEVVGSLVVGGLEVVGGFKVVEVVDGFEVATALVVGAAVTTDRRVVVGREVVADCLVVTSAGEEPRLEDSLTKLVELLKEVEVGSPSTRKVESPTTEFEATPVLI